VNFHWIGWSTWLKCHWVVSQNRTLANRLKLLTFLLDFLSYFQHRPTNLCNYPALVFLLLLFRGVFWAKERLDSIDKNELYMLIWQAPLHSSYRGGMLCIVDGKWAILRWVKLGIAQFWVTVWPRIAMVYGVAKNKIVYTCNSYMYTLSFLIFFVPLISLFWSLVCSFSS